MNLQRLNKLQRLEKVEMLISPGLLNCYCWAKSSMMSETTSQPSSGNAQAPSTLKVGKVYGISSTEVIAPQVIFSHNLNYITAMHGVTYFSRFIKSRAKPCIMLISNFGIVTSSYRSLIKRT